MVAVSRHPGLLHMEDMPVPAGHIADTVRQERCMVCFQKPELHMDCAEVIEHYSRTGKVEAASLSAKEGAEEA